MATAYSLIAFPNTLFLSEQWFLDYMYY